VPLSTTLAAWRYVVSDGVKPFRISFSWYSPARILDTFTTRARMVFFLRMSR
jgi:hypothetical protein